METKIKITDKPFVETVDKGDSIFVIVNYEEGIKALRQIKVDGLVEVLKLLSEPQSAGVQLIYLGTFETSDIQNYSFEKGVLYRLDYCGYDCLAEYAEHKNALKFICFNSGVTGNIDIATGEVTALGDDTVIDIGVVNSFEELLNYNFVNGKVYTCKLAGGFSPYGIGQCLISCDIVVTGGRVVHKTAQCMSISSNVRAVIDILSETVTVENYDTKLAELEARLKSLENA